MPDNIPNCLECAHYFITHEVSFPYGCRAMNFKSRRLPVLDVIAATGEPCLTFTPKSRKPRPDPPR